MTCEYCSLLTIQTALGLPTTPASTWKFDDHTLNDILKLAWEDLSPESSELIDNVNALPIIRNEQVFPYLTSSSE